MLFGLIKSRAQRDRESIRDIVVAAVLKSEAAATSEIRTLETEVEPKLRRQAITRLVNVVVNCDRTPEAVEIWQQRAESQKSSGNLHHALGTSLGTRLVACGVLLLKVEGKEWLEASLAFARLEGLLTGLVSHYGVEAWPVHYAYDFKFEEYRKAVAAARLQEESELNATQCTDV